MTDFGKLCSAKLVACLTVKMPSDKKKFMSSQEFMHKVLRSLSADQCKKHGKPAFAVAVTKAAIDSKTNEALSFLDMNFNCYVASKRGQVRTLRTLSKTLLDLVDDARAIFKCKKVTLR